VLYHLLYPLHTKISGFNIFQYITFRSAMAALTALLISFIIGPRIIRFLHKKHIGEEVKSLGPESHFSKKGTPTMGGIIILAAVILPTILWADLTNPYILLILTATIWMGFIGFIDDYLKNIRKSEKGLIARYKLAGQIILGIFLTIVILSSQDIEIFQWMTPEEGEPVKNSIEASVTTVPFVKESVLDFQHWLPYALFVIFVITATSNSVNLSDGLDGLASGLIAIAAFVFAGIAYITGRADFSRYLNILYLPGAGELTIFCVALVGAALGFLWFNSRPAEVFMGDTGSLAMGAAIGGVAVLLKKEFLLPFAAAIFIIESVSVILQVQYFRFTKRKHGKGKRLFLMAPLHHHFELKGWAESKVVVRFWILGILFALMTLSTFKIR